MTPTILLESLKSFVEEKTKDLILPVKTGAATDEYKERAAKVYLMHLPEKKSSSKYIPYVLLQLLTGSDTQKAGQAQESRCIVRFVAVVYDEDSGTGLLSALNLITRIRIELLKADIVGGCFELMRPLEYTVYTDERIDFYHVAEMVTEWDLPPIERKVDFLYG